STHAVVWSRSGGLRLLAEPEGYVRSEALAINNHEVVVGMVDGPRGSKTGPNGFVYEGGRLRILDEGGPNFASATALNDRGEVAGGLGEGEKGGATGPPGVVGPPASLPRARGPPP